MVIDIIYKDSVTGNILFRDSLTDTEVKGFQSDTKSVWDWESNVRHSHARRAMDIIIAKSLGRGDSDVKPLTNAQKQVVATYLQAAGIIIPPPVRELPLAVKEKIVELSEVSTHAEREARNKAEAVAA